MSGRSAGRVSRRGFLAAAGAVGTGALAGCRANPRLDGAGGGSGELGGGVTITGSSTVYPISVEMSEAFRVEHPGVNVTTDSTGSGGGFQNHFCPGNSDINGASRPITDEESALCSDNGVEPLELQIGGDALTVAVSPEVDWVDCVTFDELRQIWEPNGADRWSEVNDDWPDEPLELFGPASTSGTFDWFTEHVVGEQGSHRSDYEATEDDNTLVQGIAGSESAMGYFGYRFYEENRDRLKGLSIAETEDDECTEPTLENAKDGSYPMARPLYIYPARESLRRRAVREFLRFYVVKAETDLVTEVGYVPTSVEQRNENLGRLETAIQDVT